MASNELQRSRHGGVVCFRRRLPEDLPLLGARRQVVPPPECERPPRHQARSVSDRARTCAAVITDTQGKEGRRRR